MKVQPIKTRIFIEGESIIAFIKEHIKKIPEESVLVITSKIVALSEGRTAGKLSKKEKGELIKKESDYAVETKWVWLTVKDGMFMAGAGIDESNAKKGLVLFPEDCFKSSEIILKEIKKIYKVKKLGILITDSRTIPLRLGVVGMSVGYAGFRPIKSYIGKKDIFGKKFEFSKVNLADCLASSAVLVMGEGKEQRPIAIISDVNDIDLKFTSKKARKGELIISLEDDIYKPLFRKLGR